MIKHQAENTISRLESIYNKLATNKNLFLKTEKCCIELTKIIDECYRKKDFHDLILKRWMDEESEYRKCSFSTKETLECYKNRIDEENTILRTIAQEIEDATEQFKIETSHQDVLKENLENLYDELNITIEILEHLTQPEHNKLKEEINEWCKKILDMF